MIDKLNTPTTDWNTRRECKCGCDTFRFKPKIEGLPFTQLRCRNCDHMLLEHTALISRQAD